MNLSRRRIQCQQLGKQVYADARTVTNPDECYLYHTMDIPGFGYVEGEWDLRGRINDYLGGIAFNSDLQAGWFTRRDVGSRESNPHGGTLSDQHKVQPLNFDEFAISNMLRLNALIELLDERGLLGRRRF